jgi:hypothetical protein
MRSRLTWLFCAALSIVACGGGAAHSPATSTTLAIGTLPAAPPTTEAITPTTTPGEVYMLQAGDSPLAVARTFGLTLDELNAYNEGVSGYSGFLVGTVVWVTPPPTTVPTTAPAEFLPTAGMVTMTFTGSITADDGVVADARGRNGQSDYWPLLAHVAPFTAAADLTVCHFTDDTMPGELLAAMAFAGFDRCSNPAGPPIAIGDEVADTADFEISGIRVAHLAYATGFDPAAVVADATAERAAGADVVVVSLEWTAGQTADPTDAQRAIADEITASGMVDLIVGQTPAVEGIEQVNGVWVMWGLGEFLSSGPTGGGWPPAAEDGAIVTVRFVRGLDGTITGSEPVARGTWCNRADGHVVHLATEYGDASLAPDVRAALQRSDARTRATMGEFHAA